MTGIEPVDLFLTKEALYRLSYMGSNQPGRPATPPAGWSGRRDLNSRHPAWKAGALPAELHPRLDAGRLVRPRLPAGHPAPKEAHYSCRKSCSDYRSRARQPKSPTQDSSQDGGGGRIRTSVGVRRQIYSLFPLAAREPHRNHQTNRKRDHRRRFSSGGHPLVDRRLEPAEGFEPPTH